MRKDRKNRGVCRTSYDNVWDYGQCPSQRIRHPSHFHAIGKSNQPLANCIKEKQQALYKPRYVDSVQFDSSDWSKRRRPWNIPKKLDSLATWPPLNPHALLNTEFDPDSLSFAAAQHILQLGKHFTRSSLPCLGKWCWQTITYTDNSTTRIFCPLSAQGEPCDHDFTEWMRGCDDWESRFELRAVPTMGTGVYSRWNWKAQDVLGAFFGKLIPKPTDNTDYCHEVHIGPDFSNRKAEVAYIDAEECGNWTRFVNHSCDSNAKFVEARVGSTRVLALVATKVIELGDQVTVDYQADYFQNRECRCGAKCCKYSKKGVKEANISRPRRKRRNDAEEDSVMPVKKAKL